MADLEQELADAILDVRLLQERLGYAREKLQRLVLQAEAELIGIEVETSRIGEA